MKSDAAAEPHSETLQEPIAQQPSRPQSGVSPTPAAPFARYAGWLSITAGALFLIAQIMMWTFDQGQNLETSRDPVFIAAKIILLAGFIVLMFALIAVYGLLARAAGRLGVAGFSLAIVGTMLLGGDLWFESFAVPWLAAGSGLASKPTIVMGLGALTSYLLFAAGWALFGIASVRARVFPLAISIALIIGGIAGYWALLAPGGIPLGVALTMLGVWILRTTGRRNARTAATSGA
jgi:hypothetical protein